MVKSMSNQTEKRKHILAALIRAGKIHSQADVVRELKSRGVEVTQATASRDLQELGAMRSKGPKGEARYILDGVPDAVAVQIAASIFDKGEQNVAFFDSDSELPGISDWIEQLVAESTGKNQTGRLPIAIEAEDAPIAGSGLKIGFHAASGADLVVTGSLGEQFILWEWVTALLSYSLQVDPFNQPNVTEAKERTGALLSTWNDGKIPQYKAAFENEVLSVYSSSTAATVQGQLSDFLATSSHYIAIMAYLARGIDNSAEELRQVIASKSGKGTTFGWGPRFLHSTGQFHKGGQHNGAFLQITGENTRDLAIPHQNFSFHTLLMAQALGDGQALSDRKFPLVRIHLKKRDEGLAFLLAEVRKL